MFLESHKDMDLILHKESSGGPNMAPAQDAMSTVI